MSKQGKISSIMGAVVDIEFNDGKLPEIYNAVEIDRGDDGKLIVEVAQHLGDSMVRAVAMDSTDGLQRGITAVDTGAPISVPVGDGVLGRMFDLLGNTIDEKEAVKILQEINPYCRPNKLLVQMTDKILEREEELLKAVQDEVSFTF